MVIQLHLIESKESEKFEIAVQRFIDEIKKEKKSKSRMIQQQLHRDPKSSQLAGR